MTHGRYDDSKAVFTLDALGRCLRRVLAGDKGEHTRFSSTHARILARGLWSSTRSRSCARALLYWTPNLRVLTLVSKWRLTGRNGANVYTATCQVPKLGTHMHYYVTMNIYVTITEQLVTTTCYYISNNSVLSERWKLSVKFPMKIHFVQR